MQDLLVLDESARMNIPSSASNNWSWRLLPGQVSVETENLLNELTWLYNRR
jgi:4-alpha-glucanotransferase